MDERSEGTSSEPPTEKKRILPPAYGLMALIIMLLLHFLLPVAKFIRFPWNLIGLIPLAAGAAANMKSSNAFEKAETTVKPYKESSHLVTGGPFRISRNPMYLGGVLILLGVAILLGSLTPFAVVVAFLFLMDVVFIRLEEAMLEMRFGESYRIYKSRVRRWI